MNELLCEVRKHVDVSGEESDEIKQEKAETESTEEVLKIAQEKLDLANRRLMKAMANQQAKDLGISLNGIKAAFSLCDFDECSVDGMPDEEKVKNMLTSFAGQWPEFKIDAEVPFFAAGTGRSVMQEDGLKAALGLY